MALIIKVLLENRLGKGQDSLLQAKPGYAGAFLRDGTSVSRMYVLGPITFRREDQ